MCIGWVDEQKDVAAEVADSYECVVAFRALMRRKEAAE
jgi:hypothetical protein